MSSSFDRVRESCCLCYIFHASFFVRPSASFVLSFFSFCSLQAGISFWFSSFWFRFSTVVGLVFFFGLGFAALLVPGLHFLLITDFDFGRIVFLILVRIVFSTAVRTSIFCVLFYTLLFVECVVLIKPHHLYRCKKTTPNTNQPKTEKKKNAGSFILDSYRTQLGFVLQQPFLLGSHQRVESQPLLRSDRQRHGTRFLFTRQ